ncbi:MAG: extracellular solute-binding protein, partial [Defluviitaleaceae bacterium]|nr:extracellular solute-binding protein [Defluviitaleaceae bacterium]
APEDGYRFGMDFGNAYYSSNWFFTFGCKLFGEDGEDPSFCDFNSPGGIAAMEYVIGNRDNFISLTTSEAVALFSEHRLGAYIDGPWSAAEITDKLLGNYGCAMLPSADGKPIVSFAGYKLYCVTANTTDINTAMELAAWLTNTANQKYRFEQRNLIPVAAALVDDMDVAVSNTAKALMAQGPNAVKMPSIPQMSSFWGPTGNFTFACYNGEIEIDELPGKLDLLVKEIIG